jgi:type IV pilus assembly protein PilE
MNSYTVNPANLGYPAFNVPFGNGYYQINGASTCVAAAGAVPPCDANANPPTGPSYYLTATPVAGTSQANDPLCTSFSVDSLGNRFSTGTATSVQCWASQ